MFARAVFRPLCCLIVGHAPTIKVNEKANKSEYVCERCRAVLGDFVTNLRKPATEPVDGTVCGQTSDSKPAERRTARPVLPKLGEPSPSLRV